MKQVIVSLRRAVPDLKYTIDELIEIDGKMASRADYYRAFSTLELSAIPPYFCEPTLTIAPQGVLSAANHTALADSLAPIVHSLRAKAYGRSEFVDTRVTTLGETDALVRGVAVRYTTAGAELDRVPISYLMHRTEAGWKIAVLVVEKQKESSTSP